MPPPPKRPPNPVPELQRLLGLAVFIAWPRGVKATRQKWKHLTLDHMTRDYLSKLPAGNIGVSLGQVSGGLCAIDVDVDAAVQQFLDLNPVLADTFQTHGSRGRVFWIRLVGNCPRSFKLTSATGEALGEFRSTGNQSIVWGIHPDTQQSYQWLTIKPALQVEFDSLKLPKNPNVTLKGPPLKGPPVTGATANGTSLYNCGVAVAAVGTPQLELSDSSKAEIDRAVELGESATAHNNAASLFACLALIQLRNVENLKDLTHAERRYFAEQWYAVLREQHRINPARQKSHYLNDILTAMQNAKRYKNMTTTNPIPKAWLLAQTQPLPPEAITFAGDDLMQRLVALCYQMHIASEKGGWFLARTTVGKLMHLSETETRNLGDNFKVLEGYGILQVVKPYDKATRQATIYRYVEQGQSTTETQQNQ